MAGATHPIPEPDPAVPPAAPQPAGGNGVRPPAPKAQAPGGAQGAQPLRKAKAEKAPSPEILVKPSKPKPLPKNALDQKPARDKKLLAEQAHQTAIVLLTVLNGLVAMSFGDECRMTKAEQTMIADPLQRILERMDPGTNEVIAQWSDPIMLVLGLTAWSARIWQVVERRSREEGDDHGPDQPPEEEPPPPPPSDATLVSGNGQHEPEEVIMVAPTPEMVRAHLTGGMNAL